MTKKELIRNIYLYLFSLVGLVLIVVGSVRLVNLGLKTFVFTEADNYYSYPNVERLSVNTEEGETIEKPSEEEMAEYEEKQRKSNRQRDAAQALALLIIGVPLYAVHWRLIKKDKSN